MARLGFAVLLVVTVLVAGCDRPHLSSPAQKGSYHLRSGHYDEAIVALSEAISADPRDIEAHLNRGKAYQYRAQQGDLDRAIDDFSAVIALAPNDPDAYANRSMAYRDRKQQGDSERSVHDEAMMRKLDPRYQELENQLAETRPALTIRTTPAPENPPAEVEPAAKDAASESVFETRSRSNLDEYARRRKDEEEKDRPTPQASADDTRQSEQDYLRQMQMQRARYKAEEQARGARRLSDPDDEGVGRDRPPDRPQIRGRQPLPQPGQIGSPATAQDRFSGRQAGPTIPTSPWQRRPAYDPAADVPSASPYRSPYQSPFPQAGPRPTGRVENIAPAQPRQAPYRSPIERPAATNADDFR